MGPDEALNEAVEQFESQGNVARKHKDWQLINVQLCCSLLIYSKLYIDSMNEAKPVMIYINVRMTSVKHIKCKISQCLSLHFKRSQIIDDRCSGQLNLRQVFIMVEEWFLDTHLTGAMRPHDQYPYWNNAQEICSHFILAMLSFFISLVFQNDNSCLINTWIN